MKFLTQFALRNPLVMAVLTLILVAFGLSAYLSMGIGITPNISIPSASVTTTYAGADPATVETQITKPIEDALATMANVDTITSVSSEGVSSVQVQFMAAANTALVPVTVERAVNGVRSTLPADADAPSITTLDTSAFPVMTVALSGPQTAQALQQVATDSIQRAFALVPGVQAVSVSGGQRREIQVQVDLSKLQAYGLGLNTVQTALEAENIKIPAGQLTAGGQDVNVRLDAAITQPAQLGQIIVANTASGPVHLSDVATVVDGIETVQVLDRVQGQPAVTITTTKTADANTIAVSKGIRRAMAQLQPDLPQGMHLDVVTDAATYTQESFSTIQRTLVEAVLLTGLILFVFLHTWRSTLIVLVAIPTSLLTTLGLMNVFGLNLNLLSMLALTLCVGILVDDSIVILENISRHMGFGAPPVLAARDGRSEIGLAAITITAVDLAVYVPIALLAGITGDFMRPFALVIACATLTSLLVSFTITPLLASRFLSLQEALKRGRGPLDAFGRWWDGGFAVVAAGYRQVLRVVLTGRLGPLSMRWVVIAAGFAAFAAGGALFVVGGIGIDIFPSGDQSEVDMTLSMPPATSLAATDAVVRQMEGKLRTVPEVRLVYSAVGGQSGGGNSARMTVLLVPLSQRTRSSATISDQLLQTLDPQAPGARLDASLPGPFGFGGFGSQAIQVAVRGPDPATLNRLVDQVTAAMQSVPGAVDVNNANQLVQPEYVVQVNRNQAADLGVTAQSAGNVLRTAVGGTVVGTFQQPGQDAVNIRLMTNNAFVASPSNLTSLPLLSATGTTVQLGQIGAIVSGTAPTQIAHYNRERSVTVNASVSGQSLGTVQAAIQQRLAQIPLPPGYSIDYAGQGAQGASALSDIFKALGIGVGLMYILMLLLFRSVTLPLAVLMSLPLAVVGALGAMALTGIPFTIFSLLGFAVLLGLVGKNAILLVDYTHTVRQRGRSRTEALLEAGPTRLRPIVMTTASIFVALAPLVFSQAPGTELLKAAGIVLLGGLLTSTVLTLVFVPAMYTVFDDIQEAVLRATRRMFTPRPMTAAEDRYLHPHEAVANGAVHDGALALAQEAKREPVTA